MGRGRKYKGQLQAKIKAQEGRRHKPPLPSPQAQIRDLQQAPRVRQEQTNGEQEVGEEASSVTGGHHTEEVIEVSSVSSSEADEQTTGPTIPAL